jgi:HEAT repeat protein
VQALGKIARTDEAVPVLLAALQEDQEMRTDAAEALGKIGVRSKTVIAALEEALHDKDLTVRCNAAVALTKLDSENKRGAQEMIQQLRSATSSSLPAQALGQMGPAAHSAVPALMAAMNFQREDEGGWDFGGVIGALGAIGPAAKEAVPALIAVFERDPRDRYAAIDALGNIGPEAKAAAPLLAKALKSSGAWDQVRIALALWKIDRQPDIVVPVLVDLLSDKKTSQSAHEASRQVPPYPGEMVPAIQALAEIGPAAKNALPALRAALNDGRPQVRWEARNAIEKISLER